MKRFIGGIIFLILLSGCAEQNSSSVASVINYNDELYIAAPKLDSNNYSIDKELGTIQDTVSPTDTKPQKNFSSNYYKKGTVIYSSKEDEDIILVKENDEVILYEKE
uniref:hypothetical protein n=1 Tax=Niallia taxi TaxID=2499688 RepID=UPI003F499A3F